ncbi:MAG: glycoside hydrolase family 18 [Prevotellaceae bacterium]|jgi:hypothetical protein|nr:glycoside hydrolase family 18 [Prevotellaceae bacterium]
MNKKVKTMMACLLTIGAMLCMPSCVVEPEALEIQKPYEYDEQYYANLRAYKQSDHCLFFGWYAAYAPLEGVSGYKNPASWGERLIGLPDSVDIISFWMGIPSNDPNDPGYAPIAYADWKFVREKKGTRFVATTITRMNKEITLKDGTVYDLRQHHDDEGIAVYAQYLVDQALDAGVDGIDLDYEPEGDWLSGERFTKLVQYIGQYFGPQSENPDRLLTIDFYSATPQAATEPYVHYFIRQEYTQGATSKSAAAVQSNYNAISWVPPHKYIITEQLSVWYENAGSPFTEADGNTKTTDGSQMYSLEGFARWNPTQGKKGGFGGFYFDRDYGNKNGPYYNIRRCIQIANPAVQ